MFDEAEMSLRRSYIGSSDAGKIMAGDWLPLWEEKLGLREPEDLTWVLPVAIGSATEAVNVAWFQHETGLGVYGCGLPIVHDLYPFMRATPDGLVDIDGALAIVECKHVNPFAKIEEVERRYFPQIFHQFAVTGAQRAFLSVIIGTQKWECTEIRCDDDYLAELIAREIAFWGYVERREPPPSIAPVVAKARPAVYRTADMSQSNSWAAAAGIWCETIEDSRRCDKAAKELRALVESDVGTAAGHGVVITRSKDGRSLYLKEAKS